MGPGVLAALGQVSLEGWATYLGRHMLCMWKWTFEEDLLADTPYFLLMLLVLELEQASDSYFLFLLCFVLGHVGQSF